MSKRILLADDSAAAKKSVENVLGTDDYQIIIAEDGRVAIEQVNAAHPHLVLAHAMLPEVDGYDICRQIKENPATSHIPVLLLTGTFEPFDINRAKESRYDGFVTKPLDGPELRSLVTRCIEHAVYPAVDPGVEDKPEAVEPAPEEPAVVSDFPGETEGADAITKSDAMLDRIFPERDSTGDINSADDTTAVTESVDEDIFSIIDSDSESGETAEEDDPVDPAPETDAGGGDGDTVDRSSPDFGIWGAAAETATPSSEENGAVENKELPSEDSDLSWFLRKYEEKMQDAVEKTDEEVSKEEPQDSDTSALETIIAKPDENGEGDTGDVTEKVDDDETVTISVEQIADDGLFGETAVPPAGDVAVDEEEAEPAPETVVAPDQKPEVAPSAELDDRQLEQVARRVVELISDSVVRDVAWEAVPEIAERLIRERIKEIEEEADSSN